ncbi:MAG TPA: hypothetical protein VF240_18540 [Pyrinomonadaceae bacterium]
MRRAAQTLSWFVGRRLRAAAPAPRAARTSSARRWALSLLFALLGFQAAHASLSVTPVTWNVIGLDSNNVNSGPNTYLVGVLVCNTGGAAVTNLTGTLVWDSSNIYINTVGLNPVTYPSLAAGACTNVYFNVAVTRTTFAYNTARRYHIEITATGEPVYSTPTPREIYVEKLVSQNRNQTLSISGPTSLIVGQTYTYTVTTKTATGGYEQLETFLNFPNTIFQVLSVAVTYTAPAGATNNKIYADACGWDNDPTHVAPNPIQTYRSCIGPVNYPGGKAGDQVVTTYTVKVVGNGTATMNSMIYDFSGSSYHYSNDYGPQSLTLTSQTPPTVPLVKSVSPNGSQPPGADLTYSIAFNNTGDLAAQQFVITDPVPADTDFKIGSVTTTLGSLSGVTIQYSTDGVSWSAALPPPTGTEPAGYNRNVRHVRWVFTGTLAAGSSGAGAFTVRIR